MPGYTRNWTYWLPDEVGADIRMSWITRGITVTPFVDRLHQGAASRRFFAAYYSFTGVERMAGLINFILQLSDKNRRLRRRAYRDLGLVCAVTLFYFTLNTPAWILTVIPLFLITLSEAAQARFLDETLSTLVDVMDAENEHYAKHGKWSSADEPLTND